MFSISAVACIILSIFNSHLEYLDFYRSIYKFSHSFLEQSNISFYKIPFNCFDSFLAKLLLKCHNKLQHIKFYDYVTIFVTNNQHNMCEPWHNWFSTLLHVFNCHLIQTTMIPIESSLTYLKISAVVSSLVSCSFYCVLHFKD